MEQGEVWKAHKEDRRSKKASNREYSIKLIDSMDIPYQELNELTGHYRVGEYDYWPATGKFYNQKTGEKGRGVRNLVKKIDDQL